MLSCHLLRIRPATDRDAELIDRIASLDSTRPSDGPTLVGEVGGVAVAVLFLATGHVVADPFRRTAHVVAALRERARCMQAAGQAPGPARRRAFTLRRPRSAFGA